MSIKRRILGPIILLIVIGIVGAIWVARAAIKTQDLIQDADSAAVRTLQATERAQRIRAEIESRLSEFLEFNTIAPPDRIRRNHQRYVDAFQNVWNDLRAAPGSEAQKRMVAQVEEQFKSWNTEASIALGLIYDTHIPSRNRLDTLARRLELALVALEQEVRLSAEQVNQDARRRYAKQVVIVLVTMIGIFLVAGSAFIGFGGQLVRSLTQLAAAMERIRAGDFDTPLSDLQRRDEVGKIARGVADFSSTLRDLSEAKTHIEHLALHDQLTDLPNRRALQDYLERSVEQARDSNARHAVLHVDLDRFKQINDLMGHAAGDQILLHAAEAMQRQIGPDDMTARVGGDEFVIVLRGHGTDSKTKAIAKRVIEEISKPVEIEGEFVNVGASIGIAYLAAGETDPARILSNADIALYIAKSEGRGRVSFYNDATRARFEGNMALLRDLRIGLDNGEITAFFQPQVDGITNEVLGFEALARWHHPKRGMLDPGVFITLAFEHGLGDRLTERIVSDAISALLEWRALGLPAPSVSVNFSAKQLRDGGLVEYLDDALFAANLQPKDIAIEVLESVLFSDGVDPALNTIAKLQDRGYKIELDDFGTGHASISNLRRFKVDGIKLDKDFVAGVDQDAEQEVILRTMIDLCRNLNIECLAEGVETEAEIAKLISLGCSRFQGYGIARPMARDAVTSWLETHYGRKPDAKVS
ncbi:diguanylate cyclase/phosphodiesterase (plasmid) [Ruegeria sp. TM1040]|jgi:diguanylate cyclase (GGDEF)-like protein|uniref:putative bifunctional diguanylate cyclase/phosphodiesterase n=1 Tax=Ruegeria sp. (strain TM1040) TaxID=292414 RepID=UPI0000462C11|nr:EAL domain-containing protein [Ruegeria sp. TM1040]ABF62110.1 diguanylate cyclase/phosphodiesterase [Ruegeria sp. TM1040]